MENNIKFNENTKNRPTFINEGASIKLKIDIYTKTLLTIIAVSLLIIAGNTIFKAQNVHAYDNVQDVNIKSVNGTDISGYGLPIDLKQINGKTAYEIPVDIKTIDGHDIWNDELPVDIRAVNSNPIFGSDLPVRPHWIQFKNEKLKIIMKYILIRMIFQIKT